MAPRRVRTGASGRALLCRKWRRWGGGAARPCAILSFALQNDIVNKLVVPSLWLPNTYCQAIAAGTAE